MELKAQKRLAAKILGVGINRVWIDPARAADVEAAISRVDIRRLIHDGTIKARPERGVSRARARERAAKRKKGRRRGTGSRKGAAKARQPKKEAWIRTVRPLRAKLREFRNKRMIDVKYYRRLYRMVKGGAFRSKAHLETYLKERGILRE
ncbi:MAG: 50S ribosomal protein L19 [Hadesarchaea archaeon DG-33-1]|nr:MAG: 50S ribosomal protein L19 [Hadesarchaea archaeon DG-33-1]